MKNRSYLKEAILFVTLILMTLNIHGQKTRDEIADKYKWNLTDIYKSDADWKMAKNALSARGAELEKYKGILTRSAADLKGFLLLSTEIGKEASRLSSYASLNSDLDTRNQKYNGMQQELQQMFTELGTKLAFSDPEILSADWSKIDGYIKSDPALEPYRMGLENMFRMKKHSLTEPEERLIALSSIVTGVPSSVYNTFSNAEMPSPEVTLSTGKKNKPYTG